MPRGRFAPSPTGDLHLGSARTALAAWLDARSDGSRFILRIEDLDPPRTIPGAAARILEDLAWLGLDWDEGPDVGGPAGPYVQRWRSNRYLEALDRLARDGRLFPCFCSRADLARASGAPHDPSDEGPRYPGTCRSLNGAELAARRMARQPSLRLCVEPGTVTFEDALAGRVEQDVSAAVGDFILRRADGLFAYQLAVVVDDGNMGIERVVRGDDLLLSTPRQLLLYRALGLPPPAFAHVPLVLGPDGRRLSKRHGDLSLRALREAGVSPGRVVGWLAASLGLCSIGEEPGVADLARGFSLARLPRTATVLDELHPFSR